MLSEKPICVLLRLSEVSPMLPLKQLTKRLFFVLLQIKVFTSTFVCVLIFVLDVVTPLCSPFYVLSKQVSDR